MNKKQLYETIMLNVAKLVKAVLNETLGYGDDYWDSDEDDEDCGPKEPKEFSDEDLEEIRQYILEDEDFYNCFCQSGNFNYYSSYEDAVEDFIRFLRDDIEDFTDEDPDFPGVHADFILDYHNLGISWMDMKSGKILNCDNLYSTFKDVISAL